MATPPFNTEPGRSIDIEIGGQEVITLELNDLERDPTDVLGLLKDGQCKVWVWTRLAGEYWRKGWLEGAEAIAKSAIEHFTSTNSLSSLPPVYCILANIQLAYARQAPKLILTDARADDMSKSNDKEKHHKEAAVFLNLAEKAALESGESTSQILGYLSRGIYLLATRSMDDALRAFEGVLSLRPTNIIALSGKARILYTRKQFRDSLKVFQQILTLNPKAQPDPRIGIGLCMWSLGHRERAKAAWLRSLEVNPNDWPAKLLVGLEAINHSKDTRLPLDERTAAYKTGMNYIQKVFNANKTSAAAANALSEYFLGRDTFDKALKLAERAIQYADTLTVLSDGYLRAARVSHAQCQYEEAARHYAIAAEESPANVVAVIGLAQMQLQTDELAAAIHTLDKLAGQKIDATSPEALIMLASLRSYARPALSSSDLAQERVKARELYDRVTKALEASTHANGIVGIRTNIAELANDAEMFIEIARLWQNDSLEKAIKALKQAVRIQQQTHQGSSSPNLLQLKLQNNLAVLKHLDNNLTEARPLYEDALPATLQIEGVDSEAASTTILYNLARVYEDQSEVAMAKDAYNKLLARHPEYPDAKVRLAQMHLSVKRHDDAHQLIKQALVSSETKDFNLRAFYIYFLSQTPGRGKDAKNFTFASLKDDGSHDVYYLCAAGRLLYSEARENRDPSPQAQNARKENFIKAANIFLKALSIDPCCAIAAQGLAIMIAEDALGSWTPGQVPDESQTRSMHLRNARQALDIFAKVRESLNDGSVYVNMGHCYFVRDEYDKAIESYEAASDRFYNGQNISVLMCLARTWYSKAAQQTSFAGMLQALKSAQTALHLAPNDKATLYNIAMIQQKSGEILIHSLQPAQRTMSDLRRGIENVEHSVKIFKSLASDTSRPLPYDPRVADERRKFGESLLRRSRDQIAAQETHDKQHHERLEAARKARREEEERKEQLEREKAEQQRLVEQEVYERAKQRIEESQALAKKVKELSEEEGEKKEEKRKKAAARKASRKDGDAMDVSGEEGGEEKKRKKLRKKKKKEEVPDFDGVEGEEGGSAGSGGEDDMSKREKKARTKKRIVDEDDGMDDASGRKKKKIKSKATISDSDEE